MIKDTDVTRAILRAYAEKLDDAVESDVLVAGAGPSGMVASAFLAKAGARVVICEKRLSPGGGIWGGGMFMNLVAVQPEAVEVLRRLDLPAQQAHAGLFTIDAVHLAAGLCVRAIEAGAVLLNALAVEDVMIAGERVPPS